MALLDDQNVPETLCKKKKVVNSSLFLYDGKILQVTASNRVLHKLKLEEDSGTKNESYRASHIRICDKM